MVLSVTVSGIIQSTRQAFLSRFAVKCNGPKEALDAVEGDLDWSDAYIHRTSVEASLDETLFGTLAHGSPSRI